MDWHKLERNDGDECDGDDDESDNNDEDGSVDGDFE